MLPSRDRAVHTVAVWVIVSATAPSWRPQDRRPPPPQRPQLSVFGVGTGRMVKFFKLWMSLPSKFWWEMMGDGLQNPLVTSGLPHDRSGTPYRCRRCSDAAGGSGLNARNSFLKMCPGWADDRIFQPVTNGGFQLSDIRKLLGRFQQVGRREKNCQHLSPGYAGDW